MKSKVDLVWLGIASDQPKWEHGEVFCIEPEPKAVHELITRQLSATKAVAWLFWDSALGAPDRLVVDQILNLPGDVWHAGLKLGTAALPGIIDFVHPTWMLTCDPDPDIESTSWRLSLNACLVRTEVLRQMGGIRPQFSTLAGAALEMGHRYIVRGVLTRHVPWLIPDGVKASPLTLTFEEQLRFAHHRFTGFWSHWALVRAILSGYVSLKEALTAWGKLRREEVLADEALFVHEGNGETHFDPNPRISVLIPTIDRYPYLRTLLGQLRQQTLKPVEIIVVDQTPAERRDMTLPAEFSDLPLKFFYRDHAGQCSSRNFGLGQARGEYVLFLDDDDEVKADLLEAHMRLMHQYQVNVSSGIADEVGAELPENFKYRRASDVFPTNNTLICKNVLNDSGLFDLAYDHGQRADGDLGMRVYLSGKAMMLFPYVRVLHHHAPVGGLRTHKARIVTRASSRQNLTVRHLPSVTEIYLAKRYFTQRQVREMLWLFAFGTFSVKGGPRKKLLKLFISTAYFPHTIRQIRRNHSLALAMLKEFPKISSLSEAVQDRECIASDGSTLAA